MSEQDSTANDYALAKYLDERVAAIFALVADHYNHDLPDLDDINRSYVLLVHELKQLYDRNPKLSGIRENICWRSFSTLDAIDPYDLYEYSDDYKNHGIQHISQVKSLSIIAGKEEPDLTPELKKILDEANTSVTTFIAELDKVAPSVKNWCIAEYTLTYKYGVILINDVLKLKKSHDGSVLDKLMLQAVAKPNTLFPPQLDGKRTISTIISNAGFTVPLRKLFFPEIGKSRGVLFRPSVSSETAKSERIDTTELDLQLKELGAATKPISPF